MIIEVMVMDEAPHSYLSKKTNATVTVHRLSCRDVDKVYRCQSNFQYQPSDDEVKQIGIGNFRDNKYRIGVKTLRGSKFSDVLEIQGELILEKKSPAPAK
jgi:hypothetical protein